MSDVDGYPVDIVDDDEATIDEAAFSRGIARAVALDEAWYARYDGWVE